MTRMKEGDGLKGTRPEERWAGRGGVGLQGERKR
jgi:hypothetical protein